MAAFSDKFYIGTSGLILPVANKSLYPEAFKDKSRLSFYSSLFSTIEINSSFYKIPQASTVRKWSAEVPDKFRFTFKLFKEITHSKNLMYNHELVSLFLETVSQVDDKAGCLLLQFPASLKVKDVGNLERLLSDIHSHPSAIQWNIALEFRNEDWYINEVFDLVSEYKSSIVIHDKGNFGSAHHDTNTNAVYLRMHGPSGNYRDSYDDGFLYEYASYINDWMEEGKTVYVYFNNTMGSAIANLTTLRKAVNELSG